MTRAGLSTRGSEATRACRTVGSHASVALCRTMSHRVRMTLRERNGMWRQAWFDAPLRTEVRGTWEMAALGSDASWLAAAGTPAPLCFCPPDESLFVPFCRSIPRYATTCSIWEWSSGCCSVERG
eukprot:scaffold24720_cov61-Phaeocystis_antarctica.AAC.3